MSNYLLPLLLLLVVAIPLVLGTRKQKKAAQEHQDLLSNLAPGDRVMTTSGLYGSVADVSSETTIDVEIAPGVVTTWLRAAIREKVQPEAEETLETGEAEVAEEPVVTNEATVQLNGETLKADNNSK